MNENKNPNENDIQIEDSKPVDITNVLVGDELLNAMIDKILDCRAAIRDNSAKIKMQTHSIESLQVQQVQEVDQRIQGMEKKFVAVKEEVALLGKEVAVMAMAVANPALPIVAIDNLQLALRQHSEYFEKPMRKEIHYTHFLGWPFFTILMMMIVISGLCALLINAWQGNKQYEMNNVKWRYAKLSLDSAVIHSLSKADRQYQDNPEQFRKDVEAEEGRRAKLTEKLLQVQQNIGEINELKKGEKKR